MGRMEGPYHAGSRLPLRTSAGVRTSTAKEGLLDQGESGAGAEAPERGGSRPAQGGRTRLGGMNTVLQASRRGSGVERGRRV